MSSFVTVTKDLGTVICGKEVTELFELRNFQNVPTELSVKEEDDADGFAIKPQNIRVPPGKTARFRVTFVSHIPGIIYAKKYTICDDKGAVAEFRLRCASLGPAITPKNCTVKFFMLKNVKVSKKRVEVENKSMCPAKFHFERMGNNRPFEIYQESGLLHAQGKFILDIKFAPSQLGVYSTKIHCLLQYHEPLIFTLVGVYNPRLKVTRNQLRIHMPMEIAAANNYEAYMRNLKYESEERDSCERSAKKIVRFEDENGNEGETGSDNAYDENKAKEEEISNSISRKDTNQVVLTTYFMNIKNEFSFSKRIELINNSDRKEFFFEWNNENGKHFSVAPKNGNLKEGEKLELRINFAPDLQHRLYHGELGVRIFPLKSEFDELSAETITLPVTLNLTAIGHSFEADSAHWLEQCEFEPKEVILPPCAPGQVVHSTLLIKRRGQLPVTFEFVPPEKSCIKIKPPMGYISSSYQLLVVQFNASLKSDGKCSETWEVVYNHKTNYSSQIRISAKVENPAIIIGNDNSFKFDTILPGGISKSVVPVRNPTNLALHYEFVIPEHMNWIEIPVVMGELEPLGNGFVDMIFKPSEANEYSDCVVCSMKTIHAPEYKSSTKIELQGSCQDGFLVATPACHDFGKCLCGAEQRKIFKVFNFTPALMHYELHVSNDGPFYELENNIIELVPEKGSISGKSDIEVEVRITPNVVELSKHVIQCRLLPSKTENISACPLMDARTLFAVKIEGSLPTFQIIDLNVEGGGPLISPDWLWKMMDINGLNKILRKIRPGEEASIGVRLPEAVVDSTPLMVHMLVETKNLHGMLLEIRNTHCSHLCSQPSWTTASDGEGCNFMAFTPTKLCLEPSSREVLNLALTYEAVGASVYEWSMHLSLNRVVNIKTTVHAFSKDSPQTSTYLRPDINLRSVYIGDPSPLVQLFWLYNNTPVPTAYIVDKTSLRESTPPFHKIFDCLNPNGVLPPFSSLPLMLTFRPKQLKLYEGSTGMCLNSDHTLNLRLTGAGTLNYSRFTEFCHEQTVPEKPILRECCIALEQSTKVFTINPFSTFSDIRRVFFLKNTSKESVWAFQWHSFKVRDVITGRIEPVNGKIVPGEKLLLTLIIKSFKYPTNVTFSIPCDVVDYTALEIYEKAVKLKESVDEKFKDHFTITENGLFNEVPEIKIPVKPKQRHIFIAVRTNIVAESSIEYKLCRKDIEKLQIGNETFNTLRNTCVISEDVRHVANETMEKIIWKILNSSNFEKRLAHYQESYGGVTYLQIMPESCRKAKEREERSRLSLPKYHIERVLENTIIDILKKNFGRGRELKN